MREAIEEANKAVLTDEVPVGCVIVYNGEIIARGHNDREESQQTIAHAEIRAITKANEKIGSWRLEDCDLYVTLEPCIMCLGTMINARIKNVYYGAPDLKINAYASIIKPKENDFNHSINVVGGILEDECENMLKKFFIQLREKRK